MPTPGERTSPKARLTLLIVFSAMAASACLVWVGGETWFRRENGSLERTVDWEQGVVLSEVDARDDLPAASSSAPPPELLFPAVPLLENSFPGPPGETGSDPATPPVLDATDIDLNPTSWEDPFQPAYWHLAGWQFDGESMLCVSEESAVAVFRRPYQRLMVELRLVVPKPAASISVSSREGGAAAQGTFSVLLAAQTENRTAIVFAPRQVMVIEERLGEFIEVGHAEWPQSLVPGEAIHLRVAATGHRIVVSCNGTRVLSCDQPAMQSGRERHWALVSATPGLQITSMRIEGE